MEMNDYAMESAGFGALVGVLGMLILVFMLLFFIIALVTIIARWKAYKKMGMEGWKSIIPIYCDYALFKQLGLNPWWILIVIVSAIISPIPVIGQLIYAVIVIYYSIIKANSISKSFGKDIGYTILFILFEPFIWMMFGFSKMEFVGNRPCNDPIMNFFNKNNQTQEQTVTSTVAQNEQTSTEQTAPQAFCPNCGTKNESNSGFCANCGTKL